MDIPQPDSWVASITALGSFAVMISGLIIVYKRLKAKDQNFGPNSLKAMGVVLFIPAVLLLAIVADFQSETLAALLGTVAGYVLSNGKPEE